MFIYIIYTYKVTTVYKNWSSRFVQLIVKIINIIIHKKILFDEFLIRNTFIF